MSELSDATAREVMEFQLEPWKADAQYIEDYVWTSIDQTIQIPQDDWSPDTRWDHCGMVVDKMREDGWQYVISADERSSRCLFRKQKPNGIWVQRTAYGEPDEIKETVSRAALAAKRSERGEA